MKFSVVIPLYNKAPYIEFTLHSVLAQTCPNFEVVVVDDGSLDSGPELVQRLAELDARVRLVQQPNGGVSAARNTGIAAARGDWVAFLDADDWWHSDYLATQAAAIAAKPDVHMAATLLRRVPDAVNWNPLPWPAMPADVEPALITDLPTRWMHGIPFFTSSVVVRRELLLAKQPCFVMGESHGEDLDLWFRLAEVTNIAHTAKALVAYRTESTGSLTKLHTPDGLPPYLLRMQARAMAAGATNPKRASALNFVAQQRLTLARNALMSGRRREGLRWWLSARHAAGSKRWAMTAFMALCIPAACIAYWEQWRISRTGSS
ncbi:putative glycosyltransferase EpsJ [Curvibacter sp. AEP1-3]|uniref:glycosyltransferase family 2 protein n=1 Tax=Curvibacter sp. AEP1-3 TaxID=1844971 RepID=UPI000B3D4C02|nr:glycosyltransferase family A protein [Curvibacter sp. AEP1-3]ARV20388.1 putative glycosyltransferase EpsJ [Curvibacter sp. AEP1-3]